MKDRELVLKLVFGDKKSVSGMETSSSSMLSQALWRRDFVLILAFWRKEFVELDTAGWGVRVVSDLKGLSSCSRLFDICLMLLILVLYLGKIIS